MASKSIYKANGKTFGSMEEVYIYASENGYRVSNTQTTSYKGKTIHLITLCACAE